MATIKVTEEKCKQCIYGYPCKMLDEKSLSLKGRRCDNYEDVTKLNIATKNPNKYTQKGLQLLFLAWFILITIMLIFKHC
jgi:hypothetical protein